MNAKYDDYDAKHEGWALFICDDCRLRIQRLDNPSDAYDYLPRNPVFASDDAAIEYVKAHAQLGSGLHIAALALHETEYEPQPEPVEDAPAP